MFKIVAMIFIGILAAIGFFDLGQEAYNACGAFARHRCPPGLRPKENGGLTEGTASHRTGHMVKSFDYLLRFSKDPNATAAKMRPAALSASLRIKARGTPSVRAILLSTIANIAAHTEPKQRPALAPYGKR